MAWSVAFGSDSGGDVTRLPTLGPRQVIRALERAGFARRRQSGSHLTMKHSDGRLVVVPIHPGDIKREILADILDHAGVTEEEFRKLL